MQLDVILNFIQFHLMDFYIYPMQLIKSGAAGAGNMN